MVFMCVCPPLDKGFSTATPSTVFQPPFSTTFYRQGRVAFLSYHTQRSCGQEGEAGTDHPCVPAELLNKLSNLLFVSMVIHDTSPKPTLPQQLRRRSSAAVASLQMRTNILLKTPSIRSDSSPCR